MRVLLVLLALFIWLGFALGSVAMLGYLCWMGIGALRRPRVEGEGVPHPHPWTRSEQLLLIGALAGTLFGAAQWVTFSTHDAKFLFAAGPSLVFAVLAAIGAVVARHHASTAHGPPVSVDIQSGTRSHS